MKAPVVINLELKKKYILTSLDCIKNNQYDAPLLGTFSGAVMELLGRFLRIHNWKKRGGFENCFYDFIDKYLSQYTPHKKVLWKALRCEGSHTAQVESGISLTSRRDLKHFHLAGNTERLMPGIERRSLIIYTPKFLEDLKVAVEGFFTDVNKDPVLQENCQQTFFESYEGTQKFMKELENKGEFESKHKFSFVR